MEMTNIIDFARRDGMTDALTELLRTGAQEVIATAVEAELASYLAQFDDFRTDAGHTVVVRNGHHPASHQALKGLPEPRRQAAHDVQDRTMR